MIKLLDFEINMFTNFTTETEGGVSKYLFNYYH